MATYTAFIRKEPDTCYGVDFPDFLGCISAGDTMEEAIANAHEALRGHIAVMQADGDDIPEPMSTEDALAALDDDDPVVVVAIRAPVKGKVVRISMTIDNNLLHDLDHQAKAEGYTRSSYIAEACRRMMG